MWCNGPIRTAKRSVGAASASLKAEFDRPFSASEPFTPLPDPDTYAPSTGFADGFPAARDPGSGKTWLTHCYGMVGVGRDNDADSGGGTELYAVIGHAPRQLDRNVTLVGRVVQGIELMSSLPRGTEALGFYKTAAERTPHPVGEARRGCSGQGPGRPCRLAHRQRHLRQAVGKQALPQRRLVQDPPPVTSTSATCRCR